MSPSSSDSTSTVFLGLGSNQGERQAHLQAAVAALRTAEGLTITAVSPIYETEAHTRRPEGSQPRYLNAVVQIETTRAPEGMLRLAHEIEQAEGRRREGKRWRPRPLDIDLLAYDQVSLDREDLVLPHPRLAERRFVLRPWADLAPNFVVPPPFDRSVQVLLEQCSDAAEVDRIDVPLGGATSGS